MRFINKVKSFAGYARWESACGNYSVQRFTKICEKEGWSNTMRDCPPYFNVYYRSNRIRAHLLSLTDAKDACILHDAKTWYPGRDEELT